jgi:hypothetical protein
MSVLAFFSILGSSNCLYILLWIGKAGNGNRKCMNLRESSAAAKQSISLYN